MPEYTLTGSREQVMGARGCDANPVQCRRIDHKRQLRCLALPLIVAAIWVMWLIAVAYSALLVTGHPYAFEVYYAAESLRFTHGANIYSTDILQQTAYLHGNCTPFPSMGYVYPPCWPCW